MANDLPLLPNIGDLAPPFSVQTTKGVVSFPEQYKGSWCVFFAHPANFTTCWTMFSAFLGKKERWLNERNTKVLALSNEPISSGNDWAEKARRFIGIYLNAPVIEDLDFSIAKMYGLASTRRPQPGLERLAVIIDPEGIIRMVINRPLPNVMESLDEIALQLDLLQSNGEAVQPSVVFRKEEVQEEVDCTPGALLNHKPAHFPKKGFAAN